jgi:hypothetical protein
MVGIEVDAAVSVAVSYSAARFEVVAIDLRLPTLTGTGVLSPPTCDPRLLGSVAVDPFTPHVMPDLALAAQSPPAAWRQPGEPAGEPNDRRTARTGVRTPSTA